MADLTDDQRYFVDQIKHIAIDMQAGMNIHPWTVPTLIEVAACELKVIAIHDSIAARKEQFNG